MKLGTVTARSRSELVRLCHTDLDSRTLRTELLQRLQSIVPFNYAYFTTTDPATQLGTSTILAEVPPHWMMALFIENEYLQTDFNKFSEMLRTNQTVNILSEATGNELLRSIRYREMLLPIKMEDELRAVFVTGAACWGVLCLHRETKFSRGEAAFLAQAAPHMVLSQKGDRFEKVPE